MFKVQQSVLMNFFNYAPIQKDAPTSIGDHQVKVQVKGCALSPVDVKVRWWGWFNFSTRPNMFIYSSLTNNNNNYQSIIWTTTESGHVFCVGWEYAAFVFLSSFSFSVTWSCRGTQPQLEERSWGLFDKVVNNSLFGLSGCRVIHHSHVKYIRDNSLHQEKSPTLFWLCNYLSSIVGPKVTFFQPDDEVVGKTCAFEK